MKHISPKFSGLKQTTYFDFTSSVHEESACEFTGSSNSEYPTGLQSRCQPGLQSSQSSKGKGTVLLRPLMWLFTGL